MVASASSGYCSSDPGVLVSSPLAVFTKALEVQNKHVAKQYHKDAVLRSNYFLKVMTHQQTDVRSQLNQAMADRIASNHRKLSSMSMFKIIILCG